ncbi:MAG: DHHA1 domain-containing protein [Syntrophales bacterium]|nr:DHHA1 domain-containing protein [Syntrophales bacterium]MDY0043805.1 DHHA1 domain-containing protein [Syntrophales bacterium]
MSTNDENRMHPVRSLLSIAEGKRNFLVLCHNNPDPDAIAAAAALKFILSHEMKSKVVIGYGGIVGRAENRQLIRRSKVELTNVKDIDFEEYSFICLVDSQPRSGNNDLPRHIIPDAVIDHHPMRKETRQCRFYDIRPHYGSSSTILTEYLRELDIVPERRLATALVYGIKTDTGWLNRSASKADLEAFNFLFPLISTRTLAAIESPPMPKSYYIKFIDSINNAVQYQDVIVSDLGKINNPDVASEMADFLLRMENIRWVLTLGEYKDELILSVRTSRRGWWAGKVALRILRGIGIGGGHEKAAGGKLNLSGLAPDQKQRKLEKVIERFLNAVGAAGIAGRSLVPFSPPDSPKTNGGSISSTVTQ